MFKKKNNNNKFPRTCARWGHIICPKSDAKRISSYYLFILHIVFEYNRSLTLFIYFLLNIYTMHFVYSVYIKGAEYWVLYSICTRI